MKENYSINRLMIKNVKYCFILLIIGSCVNIYSQDYPLSVSIVYNEIQNLDGQEIIVETDSIFYIKKDNQIEYETKQSYHSQIILDRENLDNRKLNQYTYYYPHVLNYYFSNSLFDEYNVEDYEEWNPKDKSTTKSTLLPKGFTLKHFHSDITYFQRFCEFAKSYNDSYNEIDCESREEEILNMLIQSSLVNEEKDSNKDEITMLLNYENYQKKVIQKNTSESNFTWIMIDSRDSKEIKVSNPYINSTVCMLMNPKFPIRRILIEYRMPYTLLSNCIIK